MKSCNIMKVVFAIGVGLTVQVSNLEAADPNLPNILFINTDDQRPDSLQSFNLATTGNAESPLGFVLSPNVDRLAAEGVMFTNAYCQAPACGPSRRKGQPGYDPRT